MSKPRELWWGYVKAVVRAYPGYKTELEQLRKESLTPNYNATGGGTGASRKTELIALRELPPKQQKCHDAVQDALRITARQGDGRWRCRMIELVYFKQSHTLQGAAIDCHIAYATARKWNKSFINLVARKMMEKGIL